MSLILRRHESTQLASTRIETVSHGPGETQRIGRALGLSALPGHVYLLRGELGAGKTCLTQGVLWGLGGDEYARSPSFVLLTEYEARLPLYHVDLYRVQAPGEVLDLGLDEYLYGEGVCVVEWADRAPGLLPAGCLEISIRHLGRRSRHLVLSSAVVEYSGALSAVEAALSGD